MIKIMMVCGLLIWSMPVQAACLASITPTTPTSAFVINGNGTVTHKKTKLTWQRCSMGSIWNATTSTCTGVTTYTWQAALQAAQTLNQAGGFAGFTDWRLPNIKELSSIVESQCTFPAINATIFPSIPNNLGYHYWSSSPSVGSLVFYNGVGVLVWTVKFDEGSVLESRQGVNPFPVRLVRGGQ